MLLSPWLSSLRNNRLFPRALRLRRRAPWNRDPVSSITAFVEVLEDRTLLSPTIIEVDTFEDVVDPGNNLTSLREAIIQANSTEGDFEIVLAEGTYTLNDRRRE